MIRNECPQEALELCEHVPQLFLSGLSHHNYFSYGWRY